MKTKFLVILILSFALVNCEKSENEITEEFNPDLTGKIIFLKDNRLLLADVKSISSSTNYGVAIDYIRPVWSPDGSRFAAIVSVQSDMTYHPEIKIVDIKTSNIVQWKIGGSGPLTWSPDGNTIAFIGHRGVNKISYLDIRNGDIIHTSLSQVSDGFISAIAWHPDGKNIAVNVGYSHYDFQMKNDIWMIEPFDTKIKNQFSLSSGGTVDYLDWNSDGSKLLYSKSSLSRIFVINSDGSGNSEIPEILGHAPCWSKDGAYFLYTGMAGTIGSTLIFGIFVTDTEGSFEKLLLKDAGYCDWF